VTLTTEQPTEAAVRVRYVALGDSYTIGTSVAENERFPNQLVERLHGTLELELVRNLGVNGYTSGDLIAAELPALADLRPEFVTLLIGVNDVVQDVPLDRYGSNVDQILGAVLGAVPRDRIVVVSVPDYTRTPRGADFGSPDQQRAAIAEVNSIMKQAAEQRGIAFVDISSVADEAGTDAALVARDQLHPSGAQYGRWVDLIAPVVAGMFGR
jgi:lysophospholipase L1-like esterase